MSKCISEVELIYSVLWIGTIFAIPEVFAPEGAYWAVMAATATAVAVFHGIILWIAYYRQRHLAEHVLRDVREMLKDAVGNKLAVACLLLESCESGGGSGEELGEAKEVIREVAGEMDTLTEEQVQEWKQRSAQAA